MKTIRMDARLRKGKAYLVGAGPGRADLITVRGLRLLQEAEVVVYDRLIAQELLDETRADAELIFAGKRPGHHALQQEAINELLVVRVRAGKQVVRLKGGDPFVFGRGGEEALALRAAGLSYEVVPGISSAISVPAFAGIPVTQRGVATSFAVVTGHECSDINEPGTDWDALARMATLVVLMGVGQIRTISARLMEAGRAADTPAAAISWGGTDYQQTVTATLLDLPDAITAAGLASPAVIVIGDVVTLQPDLAWFVPHGDAAGFVPDQREIRLAAGG